MSKATPGEQLIASNRKAHHLFDILETHEAGLVLQGTEVKSLRDGRADLKEAYARIEGNAAWLLGCHISPYAQGNRENVDPVRTRKLLLTSRELRKLARATETTGMTIVPTRMYLKAGWIKIELAVAKGKRLHDKRETTRLREMDREMARARSVRG